MKIKQFDFPIFEKFLEKRQEVIDGKSYYWAVSCNQQIFEARISFEGNEFRAIIGDSCAVIYHVVEFKYIKGEPLNIAKLKTWYNNACKELNEVFTEFIKSFIEEN